MAKANENKELDFDSMTTEEIQQWENEQAANLKKAKDAKFAKLKAARQEGVNELINIIKKYQFDGNEFVTALFENRLFTYAEINGVEPMYLLKFPITKTKKGDATTSVQAFFYFFEGKVIISDKQHAEKACAQPFEQFTAYLTDIGKQWLNDAEKRKVIIEFYNLYTTQAKQPLELPAA
ncbi:hypothetical protein LPN04_10420 [Rugamonas sp. A1-17]|nr:hypothetical protein [Rugamonas sp. A1-17]